MKAVKFLLVLLLICMSAAGIYAGVLAVTAPKIVIAEAADGLDIAYQDPINPTYFIHRKSDTTYEKVTYSTDTAENIGWHCFPRLVCTLDGNRYAVVDYIDMKIMNTAEDKPIRYFAQPANAPYNFKQFSAVTFDGWQNIYFTQEKQTVVGGTVTIVPIYFHFEITVNSVVTYKGTVASLPSSPAVADALDRDFNIGAYIKPAKFPASTAKYSLDRISGTVRYIEDNTTENYNHEVKKLTYRELTGADYWNPTEYAHMDWRDKETLVRWDAVDPASEKAGANLFQKVSAASAILYEYPNSVNPKVSVSAGTQLQILANPAKLYIKDTADTEKPYIPSKPLTDAVTEVSGGFNYPNGSGFDYAYVLYNADAYYIRRGALTQSADDTAYATKTLTFSAENDPWNKDENGNIVKNEHFPTGWTGFHTRVLIHNLPIYKFPFTRLSFSDSKTDFAVNSLNRNYGLTDNEDEVPGLIVNRRITAKDTSGNTYYEIRVHSDGSPAETGQYVGYVDTRFVMDSFVGPDDLQGWRPNAHVIMGEREQLAIYSADPILLPDDAVILDYLKNKDDIELLGELDKSKTYTKIKYYQFDRAHEGWILTANIVENGISGWQIAAIIALCISVSVAVFALIRHFRLRKSKLEPENL